MSNSNVYFSTGTQYDNMTDERLIQLIHENNDKDALNYLMQKYKNVVEMKVSKYYINGAETDDIIQEGMIGLYKAVKGFDVKKDNLFKTFANLCIERQIITAVKGSKRQKHQPLNTYISLNNNSIENEEGTEETQLIDILNTNTVEDPLETITKNEYYKYVENKINNSLSGFEKQVLNQYIQGNSYETIAKCLNTPVKSIDNAIQRIRKKTIKNIENLT